jgi:FkbM family methyltransferase
MIGKPRRNVLVAAEFGMMIVNRFDYNPANNFGVGQFILDKGVDCMAPAYILARYFTDVANPVVIDVGANIGVFTVQAAQTVEYFGGSVYGFEPQEQLFYMACGNLALNNIDNARIEKLAVGNTTDPITIPRVNYYQPASFGSVALTGEDDEHIGQDLDFGNGDSVAQITIDEYFKNIGNVVFLKVDVEGMELPVLNGAVDTIKNNRPFLYVEYCKQSDDGVELRGFIEALDYTIYIDHINFICIPTERVDSKIEKIISEM